MGLTNGGIMRIHTWQGHDVICFEEGESAHKLAKMLSKVSNKARYVAVPHTWVNKSTKREEYGMAAIKRAKKITRAMRGE
jgi:hypothetical protein